MGKLVAKGETQTGDAKYCVSTNERMDTLSHEIMQGILLYL
jgi:hypothetical protein